MKTWFLVIVTAATASALLSPALAVENCTEFEEPPVPKIPENNHTKWFLKGETFTLNCTVEYKTNNPVTILWTIPNKYRKDVIDQSNADNVSGNEVYRSITIVNATKDDAGTYICISKNNCAEKKASITTGYHDKPILKMTLLNGLRSTKGFFETRQQSFSVVLKLEAYPKANLSFEFHNKTVAHGEKYNIIQSIDKKFANKSDLVFKVKNLTLSDSGTYAIIADNGYLSKRVTFDLRKVADPVINSFQDTICVLGHTTTLVCKASGYPLPDVSFVYNASNESIEMPSSKTEQSLYNITAYLDIKKCINTGTITCKAKNINATSSTKNLIVYEIPGGFGIDTTNGEKVLWVHEHKDISLKCKASKYLYDNVVWTVIDENKEVNLSRRVVYSSSEYSQIADLQFDNISVNDSGTYVCYGSNNLTTVEDRITINVEALQLPVVEEPSGDEEIKVNRYQPLKLKCKAEGVPKPTLLWLKDGVPLEQNSTDIYIMYNESVRNMIESTIDIPSMQQELEGRYVCELANDVGKTAKTYSLIFDSESLTKYWIAIAVIFVVSLIVVGYLIWKIKKEQKLRKELAAAGLLYFKEGATKSLNPQLGIDEQAELLPYDERFEFPPEKLKLGKQLGAGAFGVVYKAEARGIINAEETTPVAVKMVKKTADNMYIKALASELKIMVHLGRHINIVNLLGACTKNVGKRELSVIVEYCKFGNIHNYMMRHREVFIDQLTDANKEKNFGNINQAFSCTGSTGTASDYYGCTNTQETDHTFVHTGYSNRSGRKTSEGYVQPEWRSTYETDYYVNRLPRPLSSRDLLAWAFQIARGMEYLASRKVLHGDLAARNVLLAEDNVVKICDFGLARSIYKNDEYQKQENSPLPVKWLAIECMTDRIFSTQSDVWSFGIVLWELFSLAKTPYPNISPANLLQFLTEGHRLEKPSYADDRLYDVMRKCWEQKPTSRPSFTQLQDILGNFLEDNVRNHYVDLNSAFAEKNPKTTEQEDYLAMVSAPDYNNIVTPSPRYYENDTKSFFPHTPTNVDEEGYLQMSPASTQNVFSPRPVNTKFDFDPRKLNSRSSEANSCGSELTPMLTLNNLATRSGSESDHDGNAPYMNMCPRIEEETDEVFDTRQKNAKNHATNPMYITLGKDTDKKPNNNYVNINLPNGLVK